MGELPRSAWNALNRRIQFAPVWQAMLQAAVRLRSLGRRCPLALVIVLSAAFHLWYLAEDHVHATPDTITYVVPARNLAIGRGFVNAAGLPETFRTPGYPFFLAVLIKAGVEGLALAVQHLLVVGLAALVYAVTRRAGGSTAVATLAGILVGCDPGLAMLASQVLTETLFSVLIFLGFAFAFESSRRPSGVVLGAVCGLILGAAALTRPIGYLLGVPVALWLAFLGGERRARKAAAALTAFLLVLGLWVLRNERQTGTAMFSSIQGRNVLEFKAASAIAMEGAGGFVYSRHPYTAEQRYVAAAWRVVGPALIRQADADFARSGGGTLEQKSRYLQRRGIQLILAHPIGYLGAAANAALHILFDYGQTLGFAGWFREPLILCLDVTAVALFLAGLAGFGHLWRADRPLFWLSLGVVIYFLVLSGSVEASVMTARFRTPITPIYSIAVAFGIARLFRARRASDQASDSTRGGPAHLVS